MDCGCCGSLVGHRKRQRPQESAKDIQTVSVGAHLRALPHHATAHETFGPVQPIDEVPTETDAYGNAFGMDATAPDETGEPIMQADGPPVPGEDGAVVGRRLGD